MSVSTRTRLEQGGITTVPDDDVSIPLVAAGYTHPALPDRVVVRLVPEPLTAAEDLSLGVIGLTADGRAPVGHVRRRAIGFPAWPILTDPPNAQHALNLVADLERAARLARSKPGYARDLINELVTGLDASAPHFLPTLLEEAGRIFLSTENTTLAAQMFGKAREAERRHNLPIDEDRHREVLLEFAYAGAITAKELTAEARALAVRAEPAEAYQIFRRLCLERMRGGLQPYAGMQKDLARLAKAAKLDPKTEDIAVAAELLSAPGIDHAPEHFWTGYDAAIRAAAEADEQVRLRLGALTPRSAFILNDWLEKLAAAGALEPVRAGAHPDFAQRMVIWATLGRGWYQSKRNSQASRLRDVLAEVLPAAGGDGVAVAEAQLEAVPVEVVDLLVSHGITITLTSGRWGRKKAKLELEPWADRPARRDLTALTALGEEDPLKAALWRGIHALGPYRGGPEAIAATASLRPLGLQLLNGLADELEGHTNGLTRLRTVATVARPYAHLVDPEYAAAVARIAAHLTDSAEILATSLRMGLPEELDWPALSEAIETIGEATRRHSSVSVRVVWPRALVYREERIRLVEHDTTTELVNWTGHELRDAILVGDRLGLCYYTTGYRTAAQWADDRTEFAPSIGRGHTPWLGGGIDVPQGRLCGPDQLIRVGERDWAAGDAHLFVDGDRVWAVTAEGAVELDPATGRPGRASLPDWLAAHQARRPGLRLAPEACQHRPVTEQTAGSLVSTAAGYHRCAVFTRDDDPDFLLVVDADGTEYRYQGGDLDQEITVCGVIRRPGGGHWLLERRGVVDAEHGQLQLALEDARPEKLIWHHFRARDEKASKRFRNARAKKLTPLIALAPRVRGAEDEGSRLIDAVAAHFRLTDATLAHAVALQLKQVAGLWADRPQPPAAPPRLSIPPTPHYDAHRSVAKAILRHSYRGVHPQDFWNTAVDLGLADPRLRARVGDADWTELLGADTALLALAAVPGRTADEARGLRELWCALRDSGLLTIVTRVDTLAVPDTAWDNLQGLPGRGVAVLKRDHRSRTITVVRTDGGGAITVDGATLTVRESRGPIPPAADLEAVFDALIRRIETEGPLAWDPAPATRFAAEVGVSTAVASLVLAGFPGFGTYEKNFLPKDLRAALKLKVVDADAARTTIKFDTVNYAAALAAGIGDDPTTVLTDGVNTDAIAAYWATHSRTAATDLPTELVDRLPAGISRTTVAGLLRPERREQDWVSEVIALLWLAQDLALDHPLRGQLADTAQHLAEHRTGLTKVRLATNSHYGGDAERLRASLAVTAPIETGPEEQSWQLGRLTLTSGQGLDRLTADLSQVTAPDDPDLVLARRLAFDNGTSSSTLVALELALRGDLALFAESLRTRGSGNVRDPRVVDPALVEEVAAALAVSPEAACYYLQLLGLPEPTDAHLRAWNGWRSTEIADAGAELVAAGVVVQASRPRAGRGFFLPGGWAEAEAPALPIELWKAADHGYVRLPGQSRHIPQLGLALPPQPLDRWFRRCWERARSDDGPGFTELTTRRRR